MSLIARLVGDLAFHHVDIGDQSGQVFHPDRIEHLSQRNPRLLELALVVAHADRMPGVLIDHQDLEPGGIDAKLIAPARGADRAPQTRETGAKDQDPLHRAVPRYRRPPTSSI